MSTNCKKCGSPIKPYETEAELQRMKESFTAELPFMAITDRVHRSRAISEMEVKLSAEKYGFCSRECAEVADMEAEQAEVEYRQQQENERLQAEAEEHQRQQNADYEAEAEAQAQAEAELAEQESGYQDQQGF